MEQSGFFNSNNGDRRYKAEFFAKYFASFIGNGVFPNPSTNLQVIANNDMTITVKPGTAWINGYVYFNDSDLILPISVADGVLNRIDRIVLQFNTVGRIITTKVKKGAFASSPVAPVLQRDADAYELGLADIAVNKGTVSISQANITDLRLNSGLCGIVHGVIDQIDTTTLWNQYKAKFEEDSEQFEADFNTWFDTIKGSLSGDVAGNLQNQIINLQQSFTSHQADSVYQTAGGTGTAITLNINGTLVTGYPITFIASANNGGAATTINGKPLYKPGTATSPTIKAGKAYTVWYKAAGDCFFIKASATGTVTSDKVLAGETYSTEDDTDLVGTMPRRGDEEHLGWRRGIVDAVQPVSGRAHFSIPLGAYITPNPEQNNNMGIFIDDNNFRQENIISGKSIFGLWGTATVASLGGKRWASGTSVIRLSNSQVQVSGLAFSPKVIIIYNRAIDRYSTAHQCIVYSSDIGVNITYTYGNMLQEWETPITINNDGFIIGNYALDPTGYNYKWIALE